MFGYTVGVHKLVVAMRIGGQGTISPIVLGRIEFSPIYVCVLYACMICAAYEKYIRN